MFTNYINTSEISKEKSLRLDINFQKYDDRSLGNFYKFSDLFQTVKTTKSEKEKILKDVKNKSFNYVEIGNVMNNGNVIVPKVLNFDDDKLSDTEIYTKVEDKLDIQSTEIGDILISKTRPILNKNIYIDKSESKNYYTTAFYNIRANKNNKILYYALKTIFKNKFLQIQRWGKNYPTINIDDLEDMKFKRSTIDKLYKDNEMIMSKVEKLEDKLTKLVIKKVSNSEIVSSVIEDYFKFDRDIYFKNINQNLFKTKLNFLKSNDLRMTATIYSPRAKYLSDVLDQFTTMPLKNIVTNYTKGIQPQYEDEGISVICTGNINDVKVELNDIDEKYIKFVTEEFYIKHKKKSATKNDLLLSVDGEGRGKFAIYESTDKNIVDSHIAIIQINSEIYNPNFLNYFLQSLLGSEQVKFVETHNKGAMAIQIDRLETIRIPIIKLGEQKRIVELIENQLIIQESLRKKIDETTNKIEQIFENYT